MKVKDQPIPEKVKGVVYSVNYSCGSTYIRETGRILQTRLKEHKRAVIMEQLNNSIAVHAKNTGHHIN